MNLDQKSVISSLRGITFFQNVHIGNDEPKYRIAFIPGFHASRQTGIPPALPVEAGDLPAILQRPRNWVRGLSVFNQIMPIRSSFGTVG